MSKNSEKYATKIHERALSEGLNYAKTHGHTIVEEVAYGRGFKSGCITGYELAEKDLALTWEDIRTIFSILYETARLLWLQNKKINDKELCEETLRKFNKAKEER